MFALRPGWPAPVVGNFDEETLNDWAQKNLAALPTEGKVPPRNEPDLTLPKKRTWQGFGSAATAGLVFKTGGLGSSDYFDLVLLAEILNQSAYTEIRLTDATAYSPSAWFIADEYSGTLFITTDLTDGKYEEALARLHGLLEGLAQERPDDDALRRIVLGQLRSWAQIPESNSEFADYYVEKHRGARAIRSISQLRRKNNNGYGRASPKPCTKTSFINGYVQIN